MMARYARVMEERMPTIRVVVLLYKVGAVASNFIEKVKSRVPVDKNVKKIKDLRSIIR